MSKQLTGEEVNQLLDLCGVPEWTAGGQVVISFNVKTNIAHVDIEERQIVIMEPGKFIHLEKTEMQ
jgi:hypothetical protein